MDAEFCLTFFVFLNKMNFAQEIQSVLKKSAGPLDVERGQEEDEDESLYYRNFSRIIWRLFSC